MRVIGFNQLRKSLPLGRVWGVLVGAGAPHTPLIPYGKALAFYYKIYTGT